MQILAENKKINVTIVMYNVHNIFK